MRCLRLARRITAWILRRRVFTRFRLRRAGRTGEVLAASARVYARPDRRVRRALKPFGGFGNSIVTVSRSAPSQQNSPGNPGGAVGVMQPLSAEQSSVHDKPSLQIDGCDKHLWF